MAQEKRIPFTQYFLPDGRQAEIWSCPLSDEEYNMGLAVIDDDYKFECEVLATGQVSLTLVDEDLGDLLIEVVPNGPEVVTATKKLITEAYEKMQNGELR